MRLFSFHTHSSFCDGKSTMVEVCESAIENVLSAIGFSSHAPVPFKTEWAMSFEDALDYKKSIQDCKTRYEDRLNIYAGLEADYIPQSQNMPFSVWRKMLDLDYIIGSVHLVVNPCKPNDIWFLDGPAENYERGVRECFDGNVQKAVECYYYQIREMITNEKPDMVAHMDKVIMNNKGRFFNGDEKWYEDAVEDTLQLIKGAGTIVEVNTRGIYRGKYHTFFPNEKIIKRCIELDIPLTVSVDAHHASELRSGFENAVKTIQKQGGKSIAYFNDGVWEQMPLGAVVMPKVNL